MELATTNHEETTCNCKVEGYNMWNTSQPVLGHFLITVGGKKLKKVNNTTLDTPLLN